MHREFLKLLEKATGVSEHIIAVILDIRGFTPFCQSVESLDVATYVKKVYFRIINDYFKNASYYKPTGDGLIITIPYTEENLKEVTNLTMNSCLGLLRVFGSLCADDHMINFPTPQKIGIGLTRGSACCIKSEDKILDYSGRVLNLASRLMDLARPSGIVFDDTFRIDLLSDKIKDLFSQETVYVRGIAEEHPIKVYYTKDYTLISDSYKQPLKVPKWKTQKITYPLKTLKTMPKIFVSYLDKRPLDENRIKVRVAHDDLHIEEFETFYTYSIDDDEISFECRAKNYCVLINVHDIAENLEKTGVTEDMEIRIEIDYPVK